MTPHEFERLLCDPAPSGRKKELYVQEKMEEHSQFIPTPGLLNHHLHFGCVISQFALDNTLIADFAYLTKSSLRWRIYFVELESPDKRIFKADKKQIGFSADFNDALAQIRSWKVFVRDQQNAVLGKLEPLWKPTHMRSNPVEFCYALVYGRSSEYEERVKRSQTLAQAMADEEIEFFSYDSLLRAVDTDWSFKKNVLTMNKGVLSFKNLHCKPDSMFAYVTHDELQLTKDVRASLLSWDYDIDAWEQGRMLTFNGKTPR